jgi:hypothetical protein
MRCLCEPIVRRANKDDNCSGRFGVSRFKSQKLLDEAAVLACSVYVDLNPIRAGLAKTPESSHHTPAHERILDRLGLSDECWLDCVKNFGRWFHRAAERVSALFSEAACAGKHWLPDVARCGEAFACTRGRGRARLSLADNALISRLGGPRFAVLHAAH